MDQITIAGFQGNYFPAKNNIKQAPVLFIHGAFGDHTGFNNIASAFAEAGYNSYAFPRRGRLGIAPDGAAGLTFSDYLEDTISVIKNIHPAPVLVGHSLGGLLALKAAEEIENIPALVLINSAPPSMLMAQPVALPYFIPLLPKIFLGKPFKPSDAAIKKLALNKCNHDIQKKTLKTLTLESGIVYKQIMLGQIKLKPNRKKIPTLVIGSTDDRIISASLHKKTVQATGATYLEYPNSGHWIIDEPAMPSMSNDIFNWLNKV